MSGTDLVARAVAIAAEAHAGQKDKAGAPYILHPLRVMLAMPDDYTRIVAVLHDLIEDCPGWTIDRLASEGFPSDVTATIERLTRRADEPYEEYIERIAGNPVAVTVKLADLHDNMDLSRFRETKNIDWSRQRRYGRAVERLLEARP